LKNRQETQLNCLTWMGDNPMTCNVGSFVRPNDNRLRKVFLKEDFVRNQIFSLCHRAEDEKMWALLGRQTLLQWWTGVGGGG
jgi:hypothetical protein